MVQFEVTPDEVENMALSCDKFAEEVSAELRGLRAYVVELETTYRGIAATTFQDLMNRYDRSAAHLNHALGNIGDCLRANAFNYTESEGRNIANLAPIGDSLPAMNI